MKIALFAVVGSVLVLARASAAVGLRKLPPNHSSVSCASFFPVTSCGGQNNKEEKDCLDVLTNQCAQQSQCVRHPGCLCAWTNENDVECIESTEVRETRADATTTARRLICGAGVCCAGGQCVGVGSSPRPPPSPAPTAFDPKLHDPEWPGKMPSEVGSVSINVQFDNYPNEIIWLWEQYNGNPTTTSRARDKPHPQDWTVVWYYMGPAWPNGAGQLSNTSALLLPNTIYRFSIFDLKGDGLCCDDGKGWVSITNETTVVWSMQGDKISTEPTSVYFLVDKNNMISKTGDSEETTSGPPEEDAKVELFGVEYDVRRTYALELYARGLTGTIPTQIGQLTKLERLWLRDNRLTGTLPSEVGLLTALTSLSVPLNELSGFLPEELGELTALTKLVLNQNQFSGAIPDTVCDLPRLKSNGIEVCGKDSLYCQCSKCNSPPGCFF